MSLVGHLDIGRSDRVAVDRTATLRDRQRAPVDVVVDNLSTTGCLFAFDRQLPIGALISIGIPGVGVRYARVSRVTHPQYACAFLTPITESEVTAALSAETLVEGAFAQTARAEARSVPDARRDDKLPLGARIVVVAGIVAALWAVIGVAIFAVAR